MVFEAEGSSSEYRRADTAWACGTMAAVRVHLSPRPPARGSSDVPVAAYMAVGWPPTWWYRSCHNTNDRRHLVVKSTG
jgi:hypothetical protein